ncbi:MAG: SDR family oxidoreductase [Bacteroidales bacterium]|jgi:UDP-N-acetylglucosamine 4-epimerase|nr:SDR family oxidoreductase [Bacteroidales bacterium]HPB02140.1 SDR family oxidoreductase [Bacteroidales bacterium]
MKTGSIFSKIKGKKCIVTGGAGFIGSHITDALLSHGAARVIVIDNLLTGSIENIKHHFDNDAFTFAQADINDANTIAAHFIKADVVFHQAALGSVPRSVENPPATDINNVHGFVNILHLCRLNKVKKVVFASSSSVYGNDQTMPKTEEKTGVPLSPYAASKVADELYGRVFADLYGMSITGLRYFNVFGPRQNPKGPYAAVIPLFVDHVLKKESVRIFGDGEQSRDFTYVSNVVTANVLSAFVLDEIGFNVMNIGCGGSTSVNELFNAINEAAGGKSKALHEPERPGDIRSSSASIARATKLIGFKPETTIDDGIRKTIEWFKKNKNVFD